MSARKIVDAWREEALTFAYDGVEVELFSSPTVLSNEHLSVFVKSAREEGVDLRLDPNFHYTWYNPPTHVMTDEVRRMGQLNMPVFREDPLEVLKQLLVDILRRTQ